MDREQLFDLFRFLADHHGFSEVTPAGGVARVQYAHRKLRITASQDDRDGFACDLLAPGDSVEFSLGVLISALMPDGSPDTSSFVSPREQADFLRAHLQRLLDMPSEVLDDCRALRFYHAGSWRNQWGGTIQLDPESIQTERARLDRLRTYFGATS